LISPERDQTLHYTPSLERPNITLYSLSGETKHYITLPLWKDQTLNYTLVFPDREYNVMFGLSREGV
jgi:hypothetical protein